MNAMLRRISLLLSVVLILAAAVLAILAGQRYSARFDWTADQRHGLSTTSQRVIEALDGPITFVAYMYPGTERQRLRERLGRYVNADTRIKLEFRDPARHPRRVRALNIGPDGAVVVRVGERTAKIDQYDEAHVTQALQRVSPGGSPWIVFVAGHGERGLNDNATAGYADFAAALDAQGLRTRSVNLAAAQAVPDNTGVLVIASPQQRYLPGEIDMIRRYVDNGGTLLWLDDPGPRYGLTPLAEDLGIAFVAGTVVYPDYRTLGTTSPAISAIAQYPNTPITRSLNQVTLFPFAGALAATDDGDWQADVILRSATRSWLETGSLEGNSIVYQPKAGDRLGPLTLGYALNRQRDTGNGASDDRAQRAVVVADSDFLDNGHLALLGNRRLGLAIVQWLAGRDRQIAIDVPEAPDARLMLAPGRLADLRTVFVIILPIGLLLIGGLRWGLRRRRR